MNTNEQTITGRIGYFFDSFVAQCTLRHGAFLSLRIADMPPVDLREAGEEAINRLINNPLLGSYVDSIAHLLEQSHDSLIVPDLYERHRGLLKAKRALRQIQLNRPDLAVDDVMPELLWLLDKTVIHLDNLLFWATRLGSLRNSEVPAQLICAYNCLIEAGSLDFS
jgi:hypothetical protein